MKKELASILEHLKTDERFRENIAHWSVIHARDAKSVLFQATWITEIAKP
ncbi:hypothetical protein [Brevibacillus choshinensis]|nr:hypothetical protein [Brevibacillus choshinensis]MED4753662.1 hypothetical protein [Brevibacillus choshinensis]